MVEFEVEFGYPAPKDPPTALVDDTLKVLKNSLGFTASLPSTGKKWYFVTVIVLTYCEKKLF